MTKSLLKIFLLSANPDPLRSLLDQSQLDCQINYFARQSDLLSRALGTPCDLILFDQPSDLAGLEQLRSAGLTQPIVVIASSADPRSAVDAMKRGASDYLARPSLTPQHLADAIRAAIRLSRSERKLQAAGERLRFLAEASRVLSDSLDYQATLATVVHLAVPTIADWCAVDLIDPDHPDRVDLRRLAAASADPAKLEVAEALRSTLSARPEADQGIYHVLKTGRPELHTRIDPADVDQLAADSHQRALIRQLHLRSAMIVPLIARGRPLGALSLLSCSSAHPYTPEDLELAEDLARRAAVAIDNALLLRDAEAARKSAEAASRAKDDFLAVLSHELRTPLSPILLAASTLQATSNPVELRTGLDLIRRNVELEARLIDDLLDLTRLRRGTLTLNMETIDAHAVLLSAIEIVRPSIKSKSQVLQLDLGVGVAMVRADAARLQQLFWILIANAVKFTPPRETIRISSGTAGLKLAIQIADSGVGITEEALPKIFDAFEQRQRTVTHSFGGLGLGLAIGRALATLHGGGLSASSPGPGAGATFTLSLPLLDVPQATGKQPAGTPVPTSTRRILLVDDHPDTARALSRLLKGLGYAIVTADSVHSALRAAADPEGSIDLLVSDIGLPDGSGLELPVRLRQTIPNLRAIALSGYGTPDDVRRSRDAGFEEHLTKPVNIQALQSSIRRLLEPTSSPQPDPPVSRDELRLAGAQTAPL